MAGVTNKPYTPPTFPDTLDQDKVEIVRLRNLVDSLRGMLQRKEDEIVEVKKLHSADHNLAERVPGLESEIAQLTAELQAAQSELEVNEGSFASQLTIYIISSDDQGYFKKATYLTKQNLQLYLTRYKIMTDTVNIVDAEIVNFKVEYDIRLSPITHRNSSEILSECTAKLKEYFSNKNMEINKPINVGEAKLQLYHVDGISVVQDMRFICMTSANYGSNYSNIYYAFPIQADMIPATTPVSVFELKYPDQNIIGCIV